MAWLQMIPADIGYQWDDFIPQAIIPGGGCSQRSKANKLIDVVYRIPSRPKIQIRTNLVFFSESGEQDLSFDDLLTQTFWSSTKDVLVPKKTMIRYMLSLNLNRLGC